MKSLLQHLAFDAGLPIFGVAPAVYPEAAVAAYREWIARGFHADMAYLAARRDITSGLQAVLPGAASVIVAGLPYPAAVPDERPPRNAPIGLVSRYARSRDYHRVLEHALKPLVAALRERGFAARAAVDHGPFLERTLAVRAGLGFLGRNGHLIHPRFGSFLFLGVVVTNAALEPDTPLAQVGCGTCRRCERACPTQAVCEGCVDARLCLSYHTIENRGAIPDAVARRLGAHVAGCDLCGRVCPFNRQAPFMSPLWPPRVAPWLDLRSLFTTDEAAFRERFAGTALMRPGLAGLQRNAVLIAAAQHRLAHVPLPAAPTPLLAATLEQAARLFPTAR